MSTGRVVWAVITGVVFLCPARLAAQQQSADEQAVWKLEHAYWEYVKAGDLEKYRELWHPSFVGWPSSSAEPVGKDHITDWITAFTQKGLKLRSYEQVPAASHATGDVVVTHYWLTEDWVDANGHGEPDTNRITHTWVRTPAGWQIIGGMSAVTTRPPGT